MTSSQSEYLSKSEKQEAKKSSVTRKLLPPQVRDGLYHQWLIPLKRLPKRLLLIPLLIANYRYDFNRFLRGSSVNGKAVSQAQLRALITMDYHRIEKGLALREPRPGFGKDVIRRLLLNLPKYQERYGHDETVQISINTLLAYHSFNSRNNIKDEQLYEKLLTLKNKANSDIANFTDGGIVKVNRKIILEKSKLDLESFFNARHSIRQFTEEVVDMRLIEKAVSMAQKTPSVCNRQSSKVYVFSKDVDKKKVLSYQNGNRGFGDQASKVLVVISDLENFTKAGERNQCWIDGGMYAMSLVYALHSLGIGTCCLNWSVEHQVDRAFKEALGIKGSESVIMLIAVGQIPDELTVAQSPRKSVREVLISR